MKKILLTMLLLISFLGCGKKDGPYEKITKSNDCVFKEIGIIENNKLDGPFKVYMKFKPSEYDPNPEFFLYVKGNFSKDKRIGTWTYYNFDNSIDITEIYDDNGNLLENSWFHYDTGNLSLKSLFKDNKVYKSFIYDKHGKLKSTGIHEYPKKNEEIVKYYNTKDKLIEIKKYVKAKKEDITYTYTPDEILVKKVITTRKPLTYTTITYDKNGNKTDVKIDHID